MRTPLVFLVIFLAGGSAKADLFLKNFKAKVVERTVTYEAEVCSSGGENGTGWAVYYDLSAPPTTSTKTDGVANVSGLSCPVFNPRVRNIIWSNAPIGLYQSYAMVDPRGAINESNERNNILGPIEVCVGPDLVLKSFVIEISGATVTYKTNVCNEGSMSARKFRVGFWNDTKTAPPASQMGNVFKSLVALEPGKCKELTVPAGRRPNGSFTAWARADSAGFVQECREKNNAQGPKPYTLSNPDLYVKRFSVKVNGAKVIYTAEVCNKGSAGVTKFFVDVYYHRPKKLPLHGDPGDEVKPVLNLGPSGACTTLSFTRSGTPDGDYQSYLQVDADDFVSEPDEGNNLSQMLLVKVGKGGTPPGPGPTNTCEDLDGDGFGVGPGCKGVPDCDDNDPKINFGAKDICGDKIDQNCNLTADDNNCPGVDCKDNDGDGFGVGKDCVLADCDDNNKAVHPWAAETCGDNKDDNCNGIADDGCKNRQCVDLDMDGFGVGPGCPGPQDCAPTDFHSKPKGKEICGDGLDNDCDNVPDDACPNAVDKDGDGAKAGGKTGDQPDCNDQDPTIGPGQKDVCGDSIDNDCDGTVDDGCPGVDCKDADGDGWGVGKDCVVADCKDDDSKVHPWAKEICGDQVDNDCDGTVDDGCPGVDCKDGDGDGWGIGAGCTKIDCDDKDGGISPWAKEICADGLDNNCDGSIDEGCAVCDDKDGDGHGIGPKCRSWDCDDKDPKTHPGAEEICDGNDNDCNGLVPKNEADCAVPPAEGCSCDLASSSVAPWLFWLLLFSSLLLFRTRAPRRR